MCCPIPLQKIQLAVLVSYCILKIYFTCIIISWQEARYLKVAESSLQAEEGTCADLPECRDHTVWGEWPCSLVPHPLLLLPRKGIAHLMCVSLSACWAEVMSEISQNNRSIMAITINWLFCDSGSVWCQILPWSFLLLRDFRIVLFHFLCKSIHSYMVHTGGGDLGSLESMWKIKEWNIDSMMFMCARSCVPMHMWLFSPAF